MFPLLIPDRVYPPLFPTFTLVQKDAYVENFMNKEEIVLELKLKLSDDNKKKMNDE